VRASCTRAVGAPKYRLWKYKATFTSPISTGISMSGSIARGYADPARLGRATRAGGTQIMNLTLLAPDIQEAVLFLPRTVKGRDPIREP
jgi:hypothetical protein